MSYWIEPGQPLEQQLHDMFAEQIQTATQGLCSYPDEDPEGLHVARKCLKRMRALLRLLRKKKFRPAQKTYNFNLRDIGTALSPYRDREVITLLLSPFNEQSPQAVSTVDPIDPEVLRSVMGELDTLGNTFAKTVLSTFAIKHLKKGMETCREIMVAAYRQYAITKSQIHLHEFRKRVKDHTYHMELMESFPIQEESYRVQIKELEDLLGDARDCDLVLDYLEESPKLPVQAAKDAKVHFILTRDRIMKEAMKLAELALAG
jgi:CHAD domain-containing protein